MTTTCSDFAPPLTPARLIADTTPLGAQEIAAASGTLPRDRPALTVRASFAYRNRILFTALSLIAGMAATFAFQSGPVQDQSLRLLLQGTGAALIATGIAVRLWSLRSICERKSVRLVATGPYSLCRNPLYLGTLSIAQGFLCVWQSAPLSISLLPCLYLYWRHVVPVEEQVLRSRFGAEFEAYCLHTPRWIPRVRGYVSEQCGSIWTEGFRKELHCGFWWMGLAVVSIWVRS
jgi:protein-S-isoprenylcysteine O-methyltransferase Ste14